MTQSPRSDQTQPNHAEAGLALAQVLAARLSHDLAGLIGTMSGTLELADSDPDALAMARETASSLQGRIKLLRTAFGNGDDDLSFREIQTLLTALPLGRRVALRLEGMNPAQIWPAAHAKLLLCAAMLGVESVAGEGELVMQQDSADAVLVAAIGPRASWPAGFITYLTDPATALEHATDQGPRGILAPFVALLAASANCRATPLIGPRTETAPPLLLTFGK